MSHRPTLVAVSGAFAWLLARPAAAHVDYVTEGEGESIDRWIDRPALETTGRRSRRTDAFAPGRRLATSVQVCRPGSLSSYVPSRICESQASEHPRHES
jgi:hypothetical protein